MTIADVNKQYGGSQTLTKEINNKRSKPYWGPLIVVPMTACMGEELHIPLGNDRNLKGEPDAMNLM